MKTSKPISTISYNTEKFLREKLWYWKRAGIIEYAMWIKHDPDVDGKKEHFHVYIKPARMVQTEDLVNDSQEYDPENPDKPLKMNVFYNSKAEDWILYGVHDEGYLREKGLMRNTHYEVSDIKATCDDSLYEMVSRAWDYRNNKLEFRIIDAVMAGQKWFEIVRSGMIPIRQMSGALIMYRTLTGQTDVDHVKEKKQKND